MTNQSDIIRAARKYRMFSKGDTVLVAVSGGPDSVAMLHALHTHATELGISIIVAHFNHGLRGEASELDAAFTKKLARGFGLVFILENATGLTGDEESARMARYEFLERTAKQIGASKIAVGHNADDRAESVLLNLIRGTGIDGLGSIKPIRGAIVRPLIDTPRSEIEAYIEHHALPFRVDESNEDVTYSRNRIRHELLPLLEEAYNPQIKSALLRLAQIASDQSELMELLAESAASEIIYQDAMDADMVLRLPRAVQLQLVRSRLLAIKGDLRDVTMEQIERVLDSLSDGSDFKLTLPSGEIFAIREGAKFRIDKDTHAVVEAFDYELQIPGTTDIPEAGLIIEADVVENIENHTTPRNIILINPNAIVGKLHVRNIRPGDKITPFGMTGTKKLQDIFVDKKISQTQRAKTAVVVDDKKALWVVGVAASESTRVTEETSEIIRLRAISCP